MKKRKGIIYSYMHPTKRIKKLQCLFFNIGDRLPALAVSRSISLALNVVPVNWNNVSKDEPCVPSEYSRPDALALCRLVGGHCARRILCCDAAVGGTILWPSEGLGHGFVVARGRVVVRRHVIRP